MNTVYGYNNAGSIKNFYSLRTVCIWAGCLGVVQAVAWIGLTITAILAYNCVITIEDTFNYSSVVKTIFMSFFVQQSCPADTMPFYEDFLKVKPILSSQDFLIWSSVYLAIAVCWVVTSGLIVNYINKDNRQLTAAIILLWAMVTSCICAIDFSLGIIFGLDYSHFNDEAAKYKLTSDSAVPIESQAAQLLAAMVVSMSLMIISLKGFILWIINAGLVIYFSTQAIMILTDNDGEENLFMSHKESEDILATRPPIKAYEEEEHKPEMISTVFANEAYIPDNTTPTPENTYSINQDLISRAARMSMDASLQDRRFRNLDNFQQYPPRQRPESSIPEAVPSPNSPIAMAAFPVPDYTPPMQRAAAHQNTNRNQRYQ